MLTKTHTIPNMLKISSISLLIALLSSLIFSVNAKADNRYYRDHQYEPVRQIKHQNYQYIYYPAHQVYYAPRSRQWYWNSGNRWQSDYSAPAYLNVDFRVGGIPISLQSALPYQEHSYVTRQYNYAWNQDRRYPSHYEKERYYRNHDSYRRHNRHND